MKRFSDKLAIVTGGGSGIGLATVERLAQEGAAVVVVDLTNPKEKIATLRNSGAQVSFEICDVSVGTQIASLVERVLSLHRRIDVLVNNAGVPEVGTVVDTSEAAWDRVMSVNLKGVFLFCRAVIPVMKKQGHGVIVNVASELGLVGAPKTAAYCASKGAVIQLTRAMAIDHAAEGLRINCVCPGPIETPMLDSFFAARGDPAAAARGAIGVTALRRLGRPEEISGLIAFAASNDASYMTGSILVADGGATAQ